MSRVAVVLFNLGGPDGLSSVRPFLFNLFNDAAIIGAPAPIRWCLAQWISRRRAPIAQDIYRQIGGRSPLLELTREQAGALETRLDGLGDVRVFICMRYWHPMSDEIAREVKAYKPDHVVLLPLYPQYSGTTSGSSLKDWKRAATKVGLSAQTQGVCCYPTDDGWIAAQAKLVSEALSEHRGDQAPRVLFSAHGLPKKVVTGGDPYQWQVEQTAKGVVEHLNNNPATPDVSDWVVCYQSRVGPLEWIGPSTEDELARAAADGKAVIVVPIAFVSEHSETLVELDIEYREEADKLGVVNYTRVAAVGTEPDFIGGLANQVRKALSGSAELSCGLGDGGRVCPAIHGRCPLSE
ncbi:MAG: ferrochelatase [Rhodospirillaceae bacterium]|nr:ferrochelatase [Rhodospirillaceae bacterium]